MNPPPPLHVVLFEPEIAGNTGAIGRTCVAACATLWLIRPLGFSLDERHRRRAGLDYWEHLTYHLVNSLDEAAAAIAPGRVWSLTTRGNRPYHDAPFAPGDALLLGRESRGLPASWLDTQPPDQLLRIPTAPEARSLNLGSATAIALYEARRQLGW